MCEARSRWVALQKLFIHSELVPKEELGTSKKMMERIEFADQKYSGYGVLLGV